MDEAEFDRYALTYAEQHRKNIEISGERPDFFSEYKVRLFAEWTRLATGRILDFGSGIGASIPHFRRYFGGAQLACSDLSQVSLDMASHRFPGPETMLKVTADGIPVPDRTFDAAFSACVFHHISPTEHTFWLKELHRVIRPGGAIAIFEHNSLNPLAQRAVRTCPFDANAILITSGRLEARCREAGWEVLRRRYHLFFPRFAAGLR